jgi:transposase
MMGERRSGQEALFYEFSLERHVPAGHLLRSIERFVELDGVRCELAPFYSEVGRPSIDPELMIRMLIVGYCFGIRSERRLCEEVHLNLAYRWFCRLGLDGSVPDHSTFSKNRHGRFRESDLLRRPFETVLQRCIDEGLVGGEGFAVDASLIQADASDRTRIEGAAGLPPGAAGRAVEEYLAVLDDAAFGAASEVMPKFIAPSDPSSTGSSSPTARTRRPQWSGCIRAGPIRDACKRSAPTISPPCRRSSISVRASATCRTICRGCDHMVPLVEVSFSTALNRGMSGQSIGTIQPGVIHGIRVLPVTQHAFSPALSRIFR